MDLYHELGGDDIRLLEIDSYDEASNTLSCSLKHCSLSDRPTYDAISYTCADPINSHNTPELIYTGPEEQVVPQITLGSHPIEVGTNLSAGLYRMHILGHKLVWADAVCINQGDSIERGHQVALMRKIYSQAASTAIWLGRAISVTDTAMDAIEFVMLDESRANVKIYAVLSGELRVDEQEKNQALLALRVMQRLPYWRRAWVWQEIILATSVIIVWGHRSVELVMGHDHLAAITFGSSLAKDVIVRNGDGRELDLFTKNSEDWTVEDPPWMNFHGSYTTGATLLQILQKSRYCKQTDPRDAVYAKLSIADDGLAVVPKPRYDISYPELTLELTKSFMECEHSLYVVCLSDSSSSSDTSASWIPDWSRAPPKYKSMRYLDERFNFGSKKDYAFRAARDTLPDFKIMNVDSHDLLQARGFALDTIAPSTIHLNVKGDASLESSQLIAHEPVRASINSSAMEQIERRRQTGLINAPCMVISIPDWRYHELRQEPTNDKDLVALGVLRNMLRTLSAASLCQAEHDNTYEDEILNYAATLYWIGNNAQDRESILQSLDHTTETEDATRAERASTIRALWCQEGLEKNFEESALWKCLMGGAFGGIDDTFYGRTLFNWLAMVFPFVSLSDRGPYPGSSKLEKVLNVTVGRRLTVGYLGAMCLVPRATADGDLICILLGCEVPIVLRPLENGGFTLVGECYVDGMMMGKAMDLLDEGVVTLDTFDIY